MNELYNREERYDEGVIEKMAAHYKEILRLLGEETDREPYTRLYTR